MNPNHPLLSIRPEEAFRNKAPDERDDMPYTDEGLPASSEDNCDTLTEDIRHAEYMLRSGFIGETAEDLLYILKKLKNGGYHADAETVKRQAALIYEILTQCRADRAG